MLNEKFPFGFKVAIKLNLTKSHATRLKSAIKEQLLKWNSYNFVHNNLQDNQF